MVKVPICGRCLVSLIKRNLHAQFRIYQSKSIGARASGEVNRVVRRCDGAPGQNRVKLYSRQRAPVELKSRPCRVDLRSGPVHRAEDVELVVMQVNRHRIIDLKRRPLRPESRNRQAKHPGQAHTPDFSGDFHRAPRATKTEGNCSVPPELPGTPQACQKSIIAGIRCAKRSRQAPRAAASSCTRSCPRNCRTCSSFRCAS